MNVRDVDVLEANVLGRKMSNPCFLELRLRGVVLGGPQPGDASIKKHAGSDSVQMFLLLPCTDL